MNNDVQNSRLRVSRRRALAVGGTISLGGLIAACGGATDSLAATSAAPTSTTPTSAAAARTTAAGATSLLDGSAQCVLSKEETQGPYWFDVDSIRSDLREDRPGTTFELALRVQDSTECTPIANAVVEIWHCDAGGVYSGFESGSMGAGGAPPSGGGPGGGPSGGSEGATGASDSGETSDGSYSVGDTEATTTDDGTYLRGAQTTDAGGVAVFTTIFPGWYRGRTTHIHAKVHVDKQTVLTTQLFFDDATKATVYAQSPYSDHAGWENNTQNDTDNIYDASGLVTAQQAADGWIGAINLGVGA
ncbi:dioxygenase family protein [Rhodococcoides trifolii]|nr:protocatechuate dioxygenase [Rhodococcus trifolii]